MQSALIFLILSIEHSMSFAARPSGQRTSFPELVGQNPQQAAAVISAQGNLSSTSFM